MTIPDDICRMLHHAAELFRRGDHAAAIAAYQRLLAAWPPLPDSWYNLAILHRRAGAPDEALACYARAIEHGVSAREEVHLQRGVIYADDLARYDDAQRELEAALALVPEYAPALLNLGNLFEDAGDRRAARGAYARAAAAEPHNALALARLVATSDIDGADDPLLLQVRNRLAELELRSEDCADLGFALGAALDSQACYDAAFDAYREANIAVRAHAGHAYDPKAMEAHVDRVIAAFPAAEADTDEADDADAPIFVCGMLRSGSTLAEQLLARHSRVVAGGELNHLPHLIASRFLPFPQAAVRASSGEIAAARAAYLAAVRDLHPAGTLLTDKRLDNALHVGLVKRLFPRARVVHTVREARDNRLSVYFLHAGPAAAYATDLGEIAHYQAQQARLMAHWAAVYPGDVFTLRYDRLVEEPEAVLVELTRFLGLAWEPGILTASGGDGRVRTASVWQVRRPIYRTSSGRWRNYAAHLGGASDG